MNVINLFDFSNLELDDFKSSFMILIFFNLFLTQLRAYFYQKQFYWKHDGSSKNKKTGSRYYNDIIF